MPLDGSAATDGAVTGAIVGDPVGYGFIQPDNGGKDVFVHAFVANGYGRGTGSSGSFASFVVGVEADIQYVDFASGEGGVLVPFSGNGGADPEWNDLFNVLREVVCAERGAGSPTPFGTYQDVYGNVYARLRSIDDLFA